MGELYRVGYSVTLATTPVIPASLIRAVKITSEIFIFSEFFNFVALIFFYRRQVTCWPCELRCELGIENQGQCMCSAGILAGSIRIPSQFLFSKELVERGCSHYSSLSPVTTAWCVC